ncbi:tRNA isopentenyltransferase [Ramicandelaber brevisporus]|nr:tRNA isopentenyltransferase [Ramicandelaber brevisporus]
MMRKCVVAVAGTTGVGKSQLAVELAKALNGEIINSDAMQFYSGFDVITNKMPLAERKGIPHHLLGFLKATDVEYNVLDYTRDAQQTIKQLHAADKLPVMVGGSHYYVQSTLWRHSIQDKSTENETNGDYDDSIRKELEKMETAQIREELIKLDSEIAMRWHPNDRRKQLRSLEIIKQTGQKHSDIIREMNRNQGSAAERLKYPTCLFWIASDQSVLDARLDGRVDTMLQSGLFDELREARSLFGISSRDVNAKEAVDYTRGILQSIGLKEFDAYLTSKRDAFNRDDDTDSQKALFDKGLYEMKLATRQYARRQIMWLKNKTVPLIRETQASTPEDADPLVHVVVLDATDLTKWSERVRDRAIGVAKAFIAGHKQPENDSQLTEFEQSFLGDISHSTGNADSDSTDDAGDETSWKQFKCDICSRDPDNPLVLLGENGWKEHLASNRHKKAQAAAIRHAKLMENPHYARAYHERTSNKQNN